MSQPDLRPREYIDGMLEPALSTRSGRPRKACSTCKSQKIRCSGERPICKRCVRLNHPCVYDSSPASATRKKPNNPVVPVRTHTLATTDQCSSPGASSLNDERLSASTNAGLGTDNRSFDPNSVLYDYPQELQYIGIPGQLILELVELYYENVYNASLLLHKQLFLRSLAAGTARPPVVLSVCAWAANFYRDSNGNATLKDQGFMIEWAQRAGKLAFQDIETLHEENIVVFVHLALFWHSRGSWRIGQLHKGTACQLIQIIGPSSSKPQTESPLEAEIRRRRFWACYLMHCQNAERLSLFESGADIMKLPLPWPEEDFDAGLPQSPQTTLQSRQSNGGIFSELIRILTIWSSILTFVKSSEPNIRERIVEIYALDEQLSNWWQQLRPDFKLTPANLPAVSHKLLPKLLLMNITYHQSFCALHSSIVPLFCGLPGDHSWSSARQSSAQVAFDHACDVSALIQSALVSHPKRISALSLFLAYSAYCGCAIQIPFMWCLNETIKDRVHANVKANIRVIHILAPQWKFAEILKLHVRYLYSVHRKGPTVLEDEPKNIDVSHLIDLKIIASNVRGSILEYNGVLRCKDTGYVEAGDENTTLGVDIPNSSNIDDLAPVQTNPQEPTDIDEYDTNSYPVATAPPLPTSRQDIHSLQRGLLEQEGHNMPIPLPGTAQADMQMVETQVLDLFNPFFDPGLINSFPNGEMMDFSLFDTSPLSLDYFELDAWNPGNDIT